jgi:hypothetical protein
MPVQESAELIAALRSRLNRQPEAVIANALYPPVDDGAPTDDPAEDLWRRRRAINTTQLERLDEVWAGPLAELSLLPIDPGPALVGAVARQLSGQLRSA